MIAQTLTAAALALVASCAPTPVATAASESAPAAYHPESGLRIIPLAVASGGKTHRFAVELAVSPQEQAMGLMFRTRLGDQEGMLFPSDPPAPRSFWMKNTPIALDIIFIGPDGRITNIEDAQPHSLEPVRSTGATSAVLELRAGRSRELDIRPGDTVSWQLPVGG